MNAILATGGLNDVAMGIAEVIDIGFFLAISGLLALSWRKRSQIAAVAAFLLALVEGVALEPWTVLALPQSNDPSDAFWLFRLRVICAIWGLLFITAAICLVKIIRHKKQKTTSV